MDAVLVNSPRETSRFLTKNFVRLALSFSCALLAANQAAARYSGGGATVGGGTPGEAAKAVAFADVPELQTGFRLLYEQRFPEARQTFLGWEEEHPDDPFGDAAVAASYLFEELYRQGVLTSDFFLNDKKLVRGIDGKPDPERMKAFYGALDHTREIARARLRSNPNDPEALFSLTLASGMQADALSILERKQVESLKHIKEADTTAQKLLAQEPDAADAWLALGVAHYIIACLSAPKRFVLRFGGIHGDRKLGMEELSRTANDGRYLKPFAKIMLALAARREKQDDLARNLLRDLNEEFPSSPLIVAEYARVSGD